MTVNSVTGGGPTTPNTSSAKTGMAALGQADFLKLLTVQMQQQDPFDPVDNKEMLAQMAQFSSLAGIGEVGDTLKAISSKLDVVLAAQSDQASGESEEIPSQE
jgi:flagellar basal-body rod modification protein FlgD